MVFLTVVSLLLLSPLVAFGQSNREYFEVPDYIGGINVNADSSSLAPNEALVIDNLLFNRYGALEKRGGVKYWNGFAIETGGVIKNIHYFTKNNGSDQLLIATQNYIYSSPFTDTVGSAASWKNKRIGYSRGCVDVTYGSNVVYGDTTWWLLAIKVGDMIVIAESSYTIDSIVADTCIILDTPIKTTTQSNIPYRVVRTLGASGSSIVSWNNLAYIANDEIPPFIFDSLNCRWMMCVDSGTIDTVLRSLDSTFYVDSGYIWVHYYTDQGFHPYYAKHITLFKPDGIVNSSLCRAINDSIATGRHAYEIEHIALINRYPFSQRIVRRLVWPVYSQYGGYDYSGNLYADIGCHVDQCGPHFTFFVDTSFVIRSLSLPESLIIVDKDKAWNDNGIDEPPSYYGYYLVIGRKPYSFYVIGQNSSNYIRLRVDTSDTSTFIKGDRYYVFRAVPYDMSNSSVRGNIKSPIFKHMTFHKNILFAYGFETDSTGDTINTGFVYHSDVGLPQKFQSRKGGLFGFDLSLNSDEPITSLWELGDDLIITTRSKIYKLMGYPDAIGNGALIQVIPNIGIGSQNAVVARDNNYAYFARNDGFYVFNGVGIDKISLKIDPLIRSYRTGGFNVGYFDENVYFSFSDSNYTLVYNEPTNAWSRLLFGIETMNDQAALIDSNYFLFAHHTLATGRVFKYPMRTMHVDTLAPGVGENISIEYKTGWMSFGGHRWFKKFDRLFTNITKKESDTLKYVFRVDFDTTARQTVLLHSSACGDCGDKIITHFPLEPAIKARFLQLQISGKPKSYVSIGRWGIKWANLSDF